MVQTASSDPLRNHPEKAGQQWFINSPDVAQSLICCDK